MISLCIPEGTKSLYSRAAKDNPNPNSTPKCFEGKYSDIWVISYHLWILWIVRRVGQRARAFDGIKIDAYFSHPFGRYRDLILCCLGETGESPVQYR